MSGETDVPLDPWEQCDRLQRVVNELSDRLMAERQKRLDADGKLIRLLDELDAMHRDNQQLRSELLELKGPHG